METVLDFAGAATSDRTQALRGGSHVVVGDLEAVMRIRVDVAEISENDTFVVGRAHVQQLDQVLVSCIWSRCRRVGHRSDVLHDVNDEDRARIERANAAGEARVAQQRHADAVCFMRFSEVCCGSA